MNASPLGKKQTIAGSSFVNISINFLGNGLECPVPPPVAVVVDVKEDVLGDGWSETEEGEVFTELEEGDW